MITTTQMTILVSAVLISGAVFSIVSYCLQKKLRSHHDCMSLLDEGHVGQYYIHSKMVNTDIGIDDIIDDFELLD